MYLVSACLCGFPSRYDGALCWESHISDLFRRGECVPVCPEVLGGLPVPRPPAEIRCGRVVNCEGADVTYEYTQGALRALEIGLQNGCTKAILKARSPSCGIGTIYDGTFSRIRVPGDGIFAAMLRHYGFQVVTEEEL